MAVTLHQKRDFASSCSRQMPTTTQQGVLDGAGIELVLNPVELRKIVLPYGKFGTCSAYSFSIAYQGVYA